MTPLIDVIFLLLIFLILFPSNEPEDHLESFLPDQGQSRQTPIQEQNTILHLLFKSQQGKRQVRTDVSINNIPVGSFHTPSLPFIESLEQTSSHAIIRQVSNPEQFDLDSSEILQKSIALFEKVSHGHKKNDTQVIFHSEPSVPYQVLMTYINLCLSLQFNNIHYAK